MTKSIAKTAPKNDQSGDGPADLPRRRQSEIEKGAIAIGQPEIAHDDDRRPQRHAEIGDDLTDHEEFGLRERLDEGDDRNREDGRRHFGAKRPANPTPVRTANCCARRLNPTSPMPRDSATPTPAVNPAVTKATKTRGSTARPTAAMSMP